MQKFPRFHLLKLGMFRLQSNNEADFIINASKYYLDYVKHKEIIFSVTEFRLSFAIKDLLAT